MQVGSLKSRGERPLLPWLGQVKEQGWHSNDSELGHVVEELLRNGTVSSGARKKIAPAMLFLSQSQNIAFAEMLFPSVIGHVSLQIG